MSIQTPTSPTDPPDQDPVIPPETGADSDSPNLNRSPPAMESNDRENVTLQETDPQDGRSTQQSSSIHNSLNRLSPRATQTVFSNITTRGPCSSLLTVHHETLAPTTNVGLPASYAPNDLTPCRKLPVSRNTN